MKKIISVVASLLILVSSVVCTSAEETKKSIISDEDNSAYFDIIRPGASLLTFFGDYDNIIDIQYIKSHYQYEGNDPIFVGGSETDTYKVVGLSAGETDFTAASRFADGNPQEPVSFHVIVDENLNITLQETATEDYSNRLLGDANNDGIVNMQDIVLMQKQISGLVKFTAIQKMACDVNFVWYEDPMITMKDVVAVQEYVAGISNFKNNRLFL